MSINAKDLVKEIIDDLDWAGQDVWLTDTRTGDSYRIDRVRTSREEVTLEFETEEPAVSKEAE